MDGENILTCPSAARI